MLTRIEKEPQDFVREKYLLGAVISMCDASSSGHFVSSIGQVKSLSNCLLTKLEQYFKFRHLVSLGPQQYD